MNYRTMGERNEHLRVEYGITPIGAAARGYLGVPTETAVLGFRTYLWCDTWAEWKQEDQKYLRLCALLRVLTEQPEYFIESIEIQGEMIIIHRGGDTSEIFMLTKGKQEERHE